MSLFINFQVVWPRLPVYTLFAGDQGGFTSSIFYQRPIHME